MRILLLLLVVSVVACGPGERDRAPVVVFAAASLRDIASEVAAAFEDQRQARVVFNFAGSNTLAQQIDAAPAADVFLSADQKWVDFLDEAGRLAPGARRGLLSNRLVLIAHRDAAINVPKPVDLIEADYRFLAVADPEAVPAGRYARALLERRSVAGADLWQQLAERIAPALDVRAALALVESDREILGIVYRTDALSSKQVQILYEFPPIDEVPITYWGALVAGGDAPGLGALFLDFLEGPEATAIIARHGFVPMPR